ncbi:TerD family protein [Rhodococcus sp. X156]|uniref:TerD family protein n=1 Tax=Rhodococcus sp. X156 TaxID=2499145 RepID=UPI000FD6EC5A|nr:TerD family protein [Rhodococcus sp. X156]
MAPVKLIRGSNTSISDLIPTLGTVVVGFGWDVVQSRGPAVELVPSAILCGESGTALSDEHLVFFNQLVSPDGAVTYVEGDVEQIEVDLANVPADVAKIVFVVYADPDLRQPGNFGAVRSAYIRVSDRSGAELVRYDIEEGSGIEITAMVFAELYRHRGGWKIRAIGQGYSTGLKGVADDFDVRI